VSGEASGGSWHTGPSKPALKTGKYTAVASQPSSLGNATGTSAPLTFEVDTLPPEVHMQSIESPSGDLNPSFTGSASEATPVRVYVYNSEGEEVTSVEGQVEEGVWSTEALTEALEDGTYTAVAKERSALGNHEGEARIEFTVQATTPSVSEPTTSASLTSAWLNATVDANGGALYSCSFEYGATQSLGSKAACAFTTNGNECKFEYPPPEPKCAFPTNHATTMYARVFSLREGTTYYYRLTVENADGKGRTGSVEGRFTTEALPPGKPSKPKESKSGTSGTSQKQPSIQEIQALIAGELAPSGPKATIATFLKKGALSSVFDAPEAGAAAIDWYYLPKGAKLGAKSSRSPAPELLATGGASFHTSGAATIKMKLTARGRALLRRLKRIRLTARCVFTPPGAAAITVIKSFQLSR
jgi:hypothetical protein